MAKILNTYRNLVAKAALHRECHSRAIHPGRVGGRWQIPDAAE